MTSKFLWLFALNIHCCPNCHFNFPQHHSFIFFRPFTNQIHWSPLRNISSLTFHNINRLFFSFPYDFLQRTFHFVPLVPYHFQFEFKVRIEFGSLWDALIWNWLDRKAERDLFHLLSFFLLSTIINSITKTFQSFHSLWKIMSILSWHKIWNGD